MFAGSAQAVNYGGDPGAYTSHDHISHSKRGGGHGGRKSGDSPADSSPCILSALVDGDFVSLQLTVLALAISEAYQYLGHES